MSRDIKYKAWLKDAKCFAEIRHISFFEGKTVVKKYDQPMSEEVWFELEDLELLQFTGLKDKNGVEIYEGDICKVTHSNNTYEYSETKTIYEVANVRFAYRFLRNNKQHSLELDKAIEVEVIGNIYENKNLLEEK